MKIRFWLMPIVAAVILTGFGSTAEAAYPQTMTTASTWVNLPRPTDDPRWATAFSHWDQRKDTDEAAAAIAVVEDIARDKPESFECQLWLCRMNYLMAMRKIKIKNRDKYCKRSIEAGTRALEIKPDDDSAINWRFSSILLMRAFTEEKLAQMRALTLKYRNVRPLPVRDDDPLWAEALKKYDGREDHDRALSAIEDFKKIDAKHPQRIEAKLFIASTYTWLGLSDQTMVKKGKLAIDGQRVGKKGS